ncbi:HNH endonuclease [Castellaniella ginsengisoli]|uniref:HNH endonuclease n=1 Tax=Castellaniella ginsengisoli TaxID=546114 RepID=A0AB39ER83_9BURK
MTFHDQPMSLEDLAFPRDRQARSDTRAIPAGTIDPSGLQGECIDGPGERTRLGYVRVWVSGVRLLAHVVAWELINGPVPTGMELDHKCRNRWCRNPLHLEPVSHAENCRRSPATTKLDWEKVREIRRRYVAGESITHLGRQFDVTKQAIWLIVNHKNWKEPA